MLSVEVLHEEIEPIGEQLEALIVRCLQEAAEREEVSGEVVVTLVNNERIHELNREYRNVDRPTDVLSFAMNEAGEGEMDIFIDEEELDQFPNMLGDIIISLPKAEEQARDYGHSLERELGFWPSMAFSISSGMTIKPSRKKKKCFPVKRKYCRKLA